MRNALFARALAAEKESETKKALEFYRMSLQIDKQFFDAWLNAGAIYSREGKSEKAIVCYQRALISREDKRAYYNLGAEYFKTGEYEKAKTLLVKAIESDDSFTAALLLLGYTEGRLENYDSSERYIQKVLERQPENAPALSALALLYHQTKRFDLASAIVEKLLRINPNDISAKRIQASLSLKKENLSESIEILQEISERDPTLKQLYRSLEEPLAGRKGEMQQRIAELQAIETPDTQDIFDLSLLNFFNGNPKEALENLKKLS